MKFDSSGAALRASLQETVLHIALLVQGASIPEIHVWRARCIGLVERLDQAMRDDGCASDVVRDVGIAQCALLDEVTLRHLPAGRRDEWMRETMLFRFHRVSSGADRIRARIEALLNESRSEPQLQDMYATLLDLWLPLEHDAYRQHVGAARPVASPLDPDAADAAGEPQTQRAVAAVATRAWPPLRRMLPAAVLLAAVWIGCDVSLQRAVERLPDTGPSIAQNGGEARP
ncbi:DotU family type IV/VI secretion system protein [Burkholderia multivorans]|uniref:DotU family type IV/VI secretion system protein n=1 Tax=Burkholderia ubonensis TaxID=101571 RepID=UPI000F6C2388|nr:DotU family type IV/VI secretion system protein [Burkholderia ubonensis]AYZ66684.1 DotU family type IV/VI secretion system protein [Burkholderia multivorans]